jgi:hypothetical protein
LLEAIGKERIFEPEEIQRDLRALTDLMGDIRVSEIRVDGNKSVLDSLSQFYVKQLPLEIANANLDPKWRDSIKTDVTWLSEQLKDIIGRTDQVLKRFSVLEKIALSRQQLVCQTF